MPVEPLRKIEGWVTTLERWLDTLRAARLTLAVLLLVSCLALLHEARGKAFWYDETVTADVVTLPTLSRVWVALFEGADSQPFGYHAALRVVTALPLDPHVSFRLLSIAGYLVAVIASFAIAQRFGGPAHGLLAALLLMSSPLRLGSLEARSFVPLVGCVAVAAWTWMNLGRQWWRPWLLGIALIGAGACHHFGVVAVGCIGLAELSVLALERRWRWGAWLAIAAGLSTLAISVPVLIHFRSVFGAHFWSPAALGQIPSTYTALASLRGAPLLFLAVCVWVGIRAFAGGHGAPPAGGQFPAPAMTRPQVVLLAAIILYPVWIVVPTSLAHAGYVARYALSCVLGMSIGASLLLSRIAAPRACRALVAGMILIVGWQEVPRAIDLLRVTPHPTTAADRAHAALKAAVEPLPIVVASGLDYLPIVYYDRTGASRFVQVIKSEAALSLLGTDSVDETASIMARFIPLNVVNADDFARDHPRFYIYVTRSEFGWAHRYFAASPDRRLTLVNDDGWTASYLVEPKVPDPRDAH